MISFSSVVLACSAAIGVFSAPTGELAQRDNFAPGGLEKRITSNTEGTSNNYFYSFWTTGKGLVEYENGHDGAYSIEWSDCGDFVGGKGWETGAHRTIGYSGSFSTDATAYLSVYGWFFHPKTEYYIVESYGTRPPGPSAQTYEGGPYTTFDHKGSVYSDGDTYDIYLAVRHNIPPPNDGITDLTQYWSVRRSKRTTGTVTTANHFDAWASLGMNLYTFGYQIVATEGYHSGGSSSITVWEITTSTNSTSVNSVSDSSTLTKSIMGSSTSTSYPPAKSSPTNSISDSSTSTSYTPTNYTPTNPVATSSTPTNSAPTKPTSTQFISESSTWTSSTPTNPTPISSPPTSSIPTKSTSPQSISESSAWTVSTPANPSPTISTSESTEVPVGVPQCPIHVPQKNQWW